MRVLHLLRTQVDAVMIGANTMRVERYARMVPDAADRGRRTAEGLAEDPLGVLVTATMDLPWDAKLFTCGNGTVVIHTSSAADPPDTATPVEMVRHEGRVDLVAMMAGLRERGVRSLLTEGGPSTFGELVGRGLIDELFLTIAPKLAGAPGAPTILEGPLADPAPLQLLRVLKEGGELFTRWGLARQ